MKTYPNHQPDANEQLRAIVSFLLRKKQKLTLSQEVKTIDKLMQAIHQTNVQPLFIVSDPRQGIVEVTTLTLARVVTLTLTHCRRVINEDIYVLQFHPFVDTFIRSARKPGVVESIQRHQALNKTNRVYRLDRDYSYFVDMEAAVSGFIDDVKQAMQNQSFKQVLYKANRTSEKNFKQLCEYIDYRFAQCGRLTVLRVDLGYHQGNIIRSEEDRLEKYWEIREDRERLFEKMDSDKLFEHLVGAVWKIEYGPEKGFHLHLLLLIHGSKVQDDESLAYLIGKYWSNDHTQGRGWDHNCNADKDRYDTLGIGVINYYDAELRQDLYNAASYLAKVDHLARALVPDGCRTFGRSEILVTEQTKMGRKRSYES